jgi:hypothetical protein
MLAEHELRGKWSLKRIHEARQKNTGFTIQQVLLSSGAMIGTEEQSCLFPATCYSLLLVRSTLVSRLQRVPLAP